MALPSSPRSSASEGGAPDAPFLDSSGRKLRTKDLLEGAGGLPVLFAFFKVGCPTCRLAWPYLQKLNALYGGRAVRVAGVCQNDAAAGKAFYKEFGNATFDLFVDPEPSFTASNAFGVEAVPHLVLVSPKGTVERVTEGWSRKEIEELGLAFASAKKMTPCPVVEADDPVKDLQPG
jgi:peroxiredoxin